MIGVHERTIHLKKNITKVEFKDEVVKEDTKKSKRIKSKVMKFVENESRDRVRDNIEGKEITDVLYRLCETP